MGLSRVLRFHEIGGPDVLKIETIPKPKPQSNEVLIKVEAFALNRADILFINGHHYTQPILPSRIGSEASGVIEEIGDDVTQFKVGDIVSTIPHDNTKYGVQGEYAVMDAEFIAPWPDGLNATQVSATWMQMLTAYFPFIEVAKVTSTDAVLIAAGSASAGLGAIAIAKEAGATVIATTRTGEKSSDILAAGADFVIATDNEDLSSRVLDITNGRGVRVVFDPIGGSFHKTYLDCLDEYAIVFIYGLLSGQPTEIDIVKMVRKTATIHPYSMFNHVRDAEALKRGLNYVKGKIQSGSLRPIIDKVFVFEDVVAAYHYMEKGAQIGKIVVNMKE